MDSHEQRRLNTISPLQARAYDFPKISLLEQTGVNRADISILYVGFLVQHEMLAMILGYFFTGPLVHYGAITEQTFHVIRRVIAFIFDSSFWGPNSPKWAVMRTRNNMAFCGLAQICCLANEMCDCEDQNFCLANATF